MFLKMFGLDSPVSQCFAWLESHVHEQTISKSFGLDSPMVEHMSFSKQKATLAQKTKASQKWLEKASNSLCPPGCRPKALRGHHGRAKDTPQEVTASWEATETWQHNIGAGQPCVWAWRAQVIFSMSKIFSLFRTSCLARVHEVPLGTV